MVVCGRTEGREWSVLVCCDMYRDGSAAVCCCVARVEGVLVRGKTDDLLKVCYSLYHDESAGVCYCVVRVEGVVLCGRTGGAIEGRECIVIAMWWCDGVWC